MGKLSDQLLGPIILPGRLTGAVYHPFLTNDLPILWEHVPLHQLQHMWFMDNGAPAHFLCVVRQHENQTISEQWTGCGGPVSWRV